VRKRGFDLEKREPVARLIEDLRTRAMTQAVECGASLILSLKGEIDAAGNVDTPEAVKSRLDVLEDDAKAAGVDGLQCRATVEALRIKLIEVLGRLRLQAYSQLVKYASRARGNGNGQDAPCSVIINYQDGQTPPRGGIPIARGNGV
jgi:hypothetical protein